MASPGFPDKSLVCRTVSGGADRGRTTPRNLAPRGPSPYSTSVRRPRAAADGGIMIERQERRARGVNRVPVARLVDICGRDTTVPAFEAESIELSGRGMHVRTPYLPPLGAPLVCRLEDDGREIVVEGVVAWQKDHEGGGEFGVQFTALDA